MLSGGSVRPKLLLNEAKIFSPFIHSFFFLSQCRVDISRNYKMCDSAVSLVAKATSVCVFLCFKDSPVINL